MSLCSVACSFDITLICGISLSEDRVQKKTLKHNRRRRRRGRRRGRRSRSLFTSVHARVVIQTELGPAGCRRRRTRTRSLVELYTREA